MEAAACDAALAFRRLPSEPSGRIDIEPAVELDQAFERHPAAAGAAGTLCEQQIRIA